MAVKRIDGLVLKDMYVSGASLLNEHRAHVDSLNVFPVPDGDTGTNMSQTISSAVKELSSSRAAGVGGVSDAIAKGALKGARGNSGVILSQILRGMARALNGHDDMDAELFIAALRGAANTAYKAVMKPKEGTILTVIRIVAEEAERLSGSTDDIVDIFRKVVAAGDEILKKTPDMLPVLKQAGVVDSGGMGLMIVLKGMLGALTGETVIKEEAAAEENVTGEYVDDHPMSLDDITFGYCTEFIVSRPKSDMKDSEVSMLRRRLERIGDCVLVISDMQIVKVHVHTDDPGKALQYALELGELDAIKIDNMREEAREREKALEEEKRKKRENMKEFAIVAVALGKGLTDIFTSLGVDRIVDGGQTMNPSIDDLRQAIEDTNAKNVFVLPNNTNIILAASQAAGLTEKNVVVLSTKSVPMGISAVLAFSAEASVEENTENMTMAAENVHTGSVTYAVRDTNFDGHDIKMGDIMGMIDNKLQFTGESIEDIAQKLTDSMVNENTALITVYYGEDIEHDSAAALADAISQKYGEIDVDIQYGGQPLYYYLIAVE